jgi:hypothetical protein
MNRAGNPGPRACAPLDPFEDWVATRHNLTRNSAMGLGATLARLRKVATDEEILEGDIDTIALRCPSVQKAIARHAAEGHRVWALSRTMTPYRRAQTMLRGYRAEHGAVPAVIRQDVVA